MSRILFSNAYFYKFDAKQWKAQQPYPPYGTIYAAALMRDCGFDVHLFDTNLKDRAAEIGPVISDLKPEYLVVYDDGFNYLTKMCLTVMREAALEMIRLGKQQGCTVIVNSSDSTDHFALYLEAGADFVVLGEGEITLRELILAIEAGTTDVSHIAGLVYGQGKSTAPRPVLHDLDTLPDPAWDLVDIPAYRDIWIRHNGYFALNMATTRGCPYKCNWCAKPIYGNRYNSRSPERVVGEIDLLVNRYNVQHFWMADDIFGLKPGWVQRFNELVREKQLRFQYKIQSRVDLLLKADTIDALASSGLHQAWVGAESGSQKILDAMDKGTSLEEIETATHLLKKRGVEVCFFLQFGYLGESKQDIEQTIRMVEKLLPDDIGISVSYPLPGTKFFETVKSMLGSKQNWVDSDDLDMMYPATFTPAYYRRLHRLVHKRFRLSQGIDRWRRLRLFNRADFRRALLTFYYAPAALLDTWRLKLLEKPNPHAVGIK
jgi:anaerobic magnesium-protoporphyrin IX monomethyl ester cyclase